MSGWQPTDGNLPIRAAAAGPRHYGLIMQKKNRKTHKKKRRNSMAKIANSNRGRQWRFSRKRAFFCLGSKNASGKKKIVSVKRNKTPWMNHYGLRRFRLVYDFFFRFNRRPKNARNYSIVPIFTYLNVWNFSDELLKKKLTSFSPERLERKKLQRSLKWKLINAKSDQLSHRNHVQQTFPAIKIPRTLSTPSFSFSRDTRP